MKTSLLLLPLAGLTYSYFQNNPVPRRAGPETSLTKESSRPAYHTNRAEGIVIAALPSYSERWRNGDNAQTDFTPFVRVVTPPPTHPSSGYTSVSGVRIR